MKKMDIDDFQEITWLEPWCFTAPGLEQELIREVSLKHPLYGVQALAVGRREDNDDVLFFPFASSTSTCSSTPYMAA
jgi:hypothetical protein